MCLRIFYDIIILGDLMKREDIEFWLVIAIGIVLIVLAVRFFIAILPIIILGLIGLLIYDSYKKRSGNSATNKKTKKIREAEIIKEKNID